MRKSFISLACMTMLLANIGCSNSKELVTVKQNEADPAAVVAEQGDKRPQKEMQIQEQAQIPFQRVIYTKIAQDDSSWEFSVADDLPQALKEAYREFRTSVPGAFLAGETEANYYVAVCTGQKPSSDQGTEVQAVTLSSSDAQKGMVSLHIEVKSLKHEEIGTELPGEVNVTQLLKVEKAHLPSGAKPDELILTGI
ncbi:hypothetical protein DCC85_01885 [Paenibacillus sp. CAA11]|uniref:hypothetical protein n=1 Tax=Paenibacillus sp. CAA11 TaxID=1532905 RepID=UPI000D35354E|nr:hypothetical protein [Paenibacillus sp. CAA11]AWB43105.1 hypothetical protein DCC85_01885 [Paenibacillus sp. CAA11]